MSQGPSHAKLLAAVPTNERVFVPVALPACTSLTFSETDITAKAGATGRQLALAYLAVPPFIHRNSLVGGRLGHIQAVTGRLFAKLPKLRRRIFAIREYFWYARWETRRHDLAPESQPEPRARRLAVHGLPSMGISEHAKYLPSRFQSGHKTRTLPRS